VLAEALGKQHGGPAALASRSTSSGEMLSLKDFELPDDLDLGSTFTAVTLPNEIKQDGEGEKGVVSRREKECSYSSQLSTSLFRDLSHKYIDYSIYYASHNTE
jgi:hypothetical protein